MPMTQIAVYLPHEHVKKLDRLVAKSLYSSRNQAIRAAVIDLLKAEGEWGVEASDRLLREIERRRT